MQDLSGGGHQPLPFAGSPGPGSVVTEILSEAGVRRVVLLSSQGVATRPESLSHGVMTAAVEASVRQPGREWTILRLGGFHSDAYAWRDSVRTRRTVAAPFADVGLPSVDPADIAAVAAAALLEDGHAGQIYELTGLGRIAPRQRAEAIGRALGEPVRFVVQAREEALAQMLNFMPEPGAGTTLSILGDPSPAELRVSPDVERILHRPPRAFAEWAGRNVAAFR